MIINAYKVHGYTKNRQIELALDSADLMDYLNADLGEYTTLKRKVEALGEALRHIGKHVTVHQDFELPKDGSDAAIGAGLRSLVIRYVG